jgi:REP element-mobilizing transposase RayT
MDGDVVGLSDMGRIVQDTWHELPSHCPDVNLDAFVVMPNHLHAIVFLVDRDGGGEPYSTPGRTQRSAPTTLPGLVRRFKTLSMARAVHAHSVVDAGRLWGRIWQRGYYEHVIRNDASLDRIREYIINNPAGWPRDPENPASASGPVATTPVTLPDGMTA